MIDLVPASRRTAELIANIGYDKLASPTPFPDFTLVDLPDHENGLSQTFTDARLFPAGLQANDHGCRFDRRMPTNQSPILSHDPDVGPAQPAAHLDSVQFAGASFPTRGRRGSTGGDTGGHFAV